MAIQSEGAVIEARNVGGNRFMIAPREKTVLKMDNIGGFGDEFAKIGAQAHGLDNRSGAVFLIHFSDFTGRPFGVDHR